MTPKKVAKLCLSLPSAVEEQPFGPETDVFKVEGKIFAIMQAQKEQVSLKCDPAMAEDLRRRYDGIIPGYHLNKRHWNTVDLAGSVPDDLIEDMVEASFDLIVAALPKVTRLRLHRS